MSSRMAINNMMVIDGCWHQWDTFRTKSPYALCVPWPVDRWFWSLPPHLVGPVGRLRMALHHHAGGAISANPGHLEPPVALVPCWFGHPSTGQLERGTWQRTCVQRWVTRGPFHLFRGPLQRHVDLDGTPDERFCSGPLSCAALGIRFCEAEQGSRSFDLCQWRPCRPLQVRATETGGRSVRNTGAEQDRKHFARCTLREQPGPRCELHPQFGTEWSANGPDPGAGQHHGQQHPDPSGWQYPRASGLRSGLHQTLRRGRRQRMVADRR